jgi:glycosyltransferase involved in cell wall biosynthesis
MKVVVLNHVFDPALTSPEQLIKTYYPLSGWCEALAGAGVSVRVVQAFHHDAERTHEGGEYIFRASRSRSLFPRRLHRAVTGFRPDVVHVNGFDTPLQTWRLRRRLPGTTAIVMQDQGGAPSPTVLKAAIRRRLMRAVDGFLFTALEQAEPWRRAGCIGSEDAVHPVLTASTSLRPLERAEARHATGMRGAPALLWVARLDANKDPLTVIEGFEIALRELPDATLTMIFQEDALLRDVQERTVSTPGLGGRVRLVGAVPYDKLAAWYSAADIFVLGSAHEVCGFAAVEACACGATPVLSGIAPFRAITQDGAIGTHWRRGDARELADALVAIGRRDPIDCRRRVLEHFEQHLSWRSVGRRAREIYETVAAARRRHA